MTVIKRRWTPLGIRHPKLGAFARSCHTCVRLAATRVDGRTYAKMRHRAELEYRVKKHQSVLFRRLGNSDPELQRNKAQNIWLVVQALDGVLIRPGETFSFWRLVGRPHRDRGFVLGMELVAGEARAGIGGGVCQISNLIFWLVLHSPLKVVERRHHSFDPFPDDGRVLPYASGATVMWPYRDLRFENTTTQTFQLKFWFDKKCINCDLRSDAPQAISYTVFEKAHRFERHGDKTFRTNELWRKQINKSNGKQLGDEFLFRNRGEVKYTL